MDKYKDIINLPHKQSTKRPHMSLLDRAADYRRGDIQFYGLVVVELRNRIKGLCYLQRAFLILNYETRNLID